MGAEWSERVGVRACGRVGVAARVQKMEKRSKIERQVEKRAKHARACQLDAMLYSKSTRNKKKDVGQSEDVDKRCV